MSILTKAGQKVTQTFGKAGLKLQKHSPEILVIGGVASLIAGGVMACRSTLHLEDAIEDVKQDIESIKTTHDTQDYYNNELDYRKDLTKEYLIFGKEIVKLYWPTILLTAVGVGCIFKGHNILRTRNAAMAMAYAGLKKSYNQFNERVVDKLGEEEAFKLRNGIETKDIEVTKTDEEGSETKEIKKKASVVNPESISDCARIFDKYNANWDHDRDLTLAFLRQQQSYFNDILHTQGYVFLSDVYKALGFEETPASRVKGWLLGAGDNFVDFGIYDVNSEQARDFVNGYGEAILLNFNDDGIIFDMI